jgi:ABC-type dipeptide/oligopeptide/nickel transport system ATPase component
MVKVPCGVQENGEPCVIFIDGYLQKALDRCKIRVQKHNWDYVCIVAGLPGSGKSTFARTIARYCDHNFNLSKVAFTANEFIKLTNNVEDYSAVILDESFQSLNTRVTMTPAFIKIINHLQIIRQKHLFIILCLPNFFDLTKGVAVFRASHLFLTYDTKVGRRGQFVAFDRSRKRRLYVKGNKYMNYYAVDANFRGRYTKNTMIMPEEAYEKRKLAHLLAQEQKVKEKEEKKKPKGLRYDQMIGVINKIGGTNTELAKLLKCDRKTIYLVKKWAETQENR